MRLHICGPEIQDVYKPDGQSAVCLCVIEYVCACCVCERVCVRLYECACVLPTIVLLAGAESRDRQKSLLSTFNMTNIPASPQQAVLEIYRSNIK